MSGFIPIIGDVVVINKKRYVLFYINYDIPVHEGGLNFFKTGYYFVSEEHIKQKDMIEFNNVKDGIVLYKKRNEEFDGNQKTNDRYNVLEIEMLKFVKV